VPLDEPTAKAAGVLCGRAETADVVDASVVIAARLLGQPVLTSDADDLRRLDKQLRIVAL
jgi:tagatose-1,6-bisphosphate aldolase